MEQVEILLGFIIIFGLYLLPTIVAITSGRKNKGAIFALNFFLGWTFFCWVIALVWALKKDHISVIIEKK